MKDTFPLQAGSPAGRRLRRLPANLGFWLIPLLFLLVFFYQPLARILAQAVQGLTSRGLGISPWESISRPLSFTLLQSSVSMLLTFLVGLPLAALFARYSFPAKEFLRALLTLPFILPAVVVAAAFNALIGPRGLLNVLLMQAFALQLPPITLIGTFWGIILAHVFYNTAIVLRVVGTAWESLDPHMEQAARVLGASPVKTLLHVTLPLLRPSILAAALLVFLFDFTSFGVILLLGGPQFATLEVAIYTQALSLLNLPLAGVLSFVQLAFTLGLAVVYRRVVPAEPSFLTPHLSDEGQHELRKAPQRAWALPLLLLALLFFAAPLLALLLRSLVQLEPARAQAGGFQPVWTLAFYQELSVNRFQSLFYIPPIEAVRNSLLYAAQTVIIAVPLGLLGAYAERRRDRLSSWLSPWMMLPLGSSAVTLGLGFILTFNRPPLDARSFPLMIPIAHSLVAFPFVLRILQPALAAIPPHFGQAAAVLGASPAKVWWHVERPLLARPLAVSALYAFSISLGEFGATTFLARPDRPTIPIAIYRFLSQPGALNYGQGLAMAVILMAVCLISMLLLQRLGAWR